MSDQSAPESTVVPPLTAPTPDTVLPAAPVEPEKPKPAEMIYKNGRKAGHREPVIYRDRTGAVRVGFTGQLVAGAVSPDVLVRVFSSGGTGCDTVPINELSHAEDALAALEAAVQAKA